MFLSVVIPAWCEADEIAAAVEAGSPDGTAALAARAGARVVQVPRGRGPQLDAGARAARGDALLFLHADARLPATARGAIAQALADPGVLGGNFHVRYAGDGAWARFFTWASDVRRRWLRIYYGDSAIFLRRAAYDRLGGFRPLPIFEDYDLVRRLERLGRTLYVRDVAVTASARRFEQAPFRTGTLWAVLQLLYSLGVPAERLAPLYGDRR
jgi:glycosyltransferase involved in cell wall biosynthesis